MGQWLLCAIGKTPRKARSHLSNPKASDSATLKRVCVSLEFRKARRDQSNTGIDTGIGIYIWRWYGIGSLTQ
jgi:hypothetical protein